MELRRLAVCLAFFVLVVSQCSDSHMIRRRDADYVNYDDSILADEAGDEDAMNDTENTEKPVPQIEKSPAVISTLPTMYKVKAGLDQRLECKVEPENAVVQWYKNNQPYFLGKFKQVEDDRYSIAPNSKDLLIRNTQASDSGTFRCEIVQKAAAAISHTLLVTEKPLVRSLTAINGGNVVEGNELALTCNVSGSPTPTVMWTRTRIHMENERLTEKDGEFTVNNSEYGFRINNIKPEEAGNYYCYAIIGNVSHQAVIPVTVQRKPRVHVTKTVVNSDLMIEAVLQCSAHEEPRPHFRWYKDGSLIEDRSTNYKISTHGPHSNLSVTPTTDEDFGTFTCEAENSYGKHNKSIELIQAPVVEDLEVDGSKMSWKVNSHQPLEEMELQLRSYNENGDGEWRRLMVPLPEGGRHEYEVTYLLDDKQIESGDYQAIIKVKNSKSWGGSNEPVNVKIINAQPQYIQTASVISGNFAQTIRPAHTMLSTILMYLLVRML